ncbi:hypothetical protein Bca101_068334 [Brassica carinata]
MGEQGQSCSLGWRVSPPGVEQLDRWAIRASPARQVGELHHPESSNSPVRRAGPVLLARLASCTSRSRATCPLGEKGQSCLPGWRVAPPRVEQFALWVSRASPARQVGELYLPESSHLPVGRAGPVLHARLASCTSQSRATRPLGEQGQSRSPGWRVVSLKDIQFARSASWIRPCAVLSNLDGSVPRFVSIGVTVEILRRKPPKGARLGVIGLVELDLWFSDNRISVEAGRRTIVKKPREFFEKPT